MLILMNLFEKKTICFLNRILFREIMVNRKFVKLRVGKNLVQEMIEKNVC